jgi:hypothetical protein
MKSSEAKMRTRSSFVPAQMVGIGCHSQLEAVAEARRTGLL